MTVGTNLEQLNVVYDNPEYIALGKRIDPTQWNANFAEIETKMNSNIILINELIDQIVASTDGVSGGDIVGITPIKEGGANKLQTVLEEMKADFGALSSEHALRTDNPHSVTKTQIGLSNVDNTADAAKNVLSATKLTTPRKIGAVNFDGSADISLSQIGGYTKTELQTAGQSVIDWNNIANKPNLADGNWKGTVQNVSALPTVGNNVGDQRVVLNDGDGKQAIYACVATTGTIDQQWDKVGDVDWMTEEQTRQTNESARQSAETQRGTNETQRINAENTRISNETQRMNNETARQAHITDFNNPHTVTKTQVGLGNVDNTSDANKPISTAQQAALDARVLKSAPQITGEFDQNGKTIGGQETDNGNSGTAKTVDWKNGNHQKVTMTDNCTFTFTNPTRPCMLSLRIVQDATGNRAVTLPTIKWAGGNTPTFTATAGAIDIISLFFDGSNYYGQVGNDFK